MAEERRSNLKKGIEALFTAETFKGFPLSSWARPLRDEKGKTVFLVENGFSRWYK